MVNIEVKLYATLRKYRPDLKQGEALSLSLPEGTTLEQLFKQELGIPSEEVRTTFVNGKAREDSYVLADGDQVGVFPPVAGG
ncbi:MAG: MoaD/ThiS family protein [Anaerolineae bacterium]